MQPGKPSPWFVDFLVNGLDGVAVVEEVVLIAGDGETGQEGVGRGLFDFQPVLKGSDICGVGGNGAGALTFV